LLSFPPTADQTLLSYATTASTSKTIPSSIRDAADVLKGDLENFCGVVAKYSLAMDDQEISYLVLDPLKTTNSIVL